MTNEEMEAILLHTLEAVKSIAETQTQTILRESILIERVQILEDEIRYLKDNIISFSKS